MLEEGLSYPLRGDSALGRFIIGGLLVFFSFLVVPAIPLLGYLTEVLGSAARDEAEPPAFENWSSLFAIGLKALVVSIVVGVVPVLVLGVSLGSTIAALAEPNSAGVLAGIGVAGLLASALVFLILYYLLPATLTNLALGRTIGSAFDVGSLRRTLLSPNYLLAWLVPVVIAIAVNLLTAALVALTLGLGALLVPFVQFYTNVAIFYMFGRAVGANLDPSALRGPPETA
jgi:hypothetical protein